MPPSPIEPPTTISPSGCRTRLTKWWLVLSALCSVLILAVLAPNVLIVFVLYQLFSLFGIDKSFSTPYDQFMDSQVGYRVGTLVALAVFLLIIIQYARVKRYIRAGIFTVTIGVWVWIAASTLRSDYPDIDGASYFIMPILLAIIFAPSLLIAFATSHNDQVHWQPLRPLSAYRVWGIVGIVLFLAGMILMLAITEAPPELTRQQIYAFIPEPTVNPLDLPEGAVIRNADWIPQLREFDGVQMALVPPGCFIMGSNSTYIEADKPAHQVCLTQSYWIDVTEVTNAAYGSVRPEEQCADYGTEPDQPRHCVTWKEAQVFCEQRGARLPTEAEWEFAARGPDNLVYPWGNTFVEANAPDMQETDFQPEKVGSRPQNASWVGALDLSGNLSEWVQDRYDEYSLDSLVDPAGPRWGRLRVTRGGSYGSSGEQTLTAAYRMGTNTDFWDHFLGFRCARSE